MATIYADNAATTQMSRAAIDAMLPYLETIYGNPSSLHSVGQQAAGALLSARDRIAKCLNASPREIYFTSGGSEADNQAILSAARLGERKGKKHIISTAFEHHAVLHTLKKLEKEGFEVELLPVGPIGTVTAQQVKGAIREDTCLVSVMYANNEIGSILPISEIGAVCREAGVLFHTDAVQAAGHLPIDVKAQNIDLLSLSAHKFHGPKGTGVLYARQGIFLTNLIEGGAQERGKRAGTENIPAIMGMAAALEDACAHLDENAKKVSALRDRLIEGLSKIPHSALNGDPVNRLPGNVSFCFEGSVYYVCEFEKGKELIVADMIRNAGIREDMMSVTSRIAIMRPGVNRELLNGCGIRFFCVVDDDYNLEVTEQVPDQEVWDGVPIVK